MQNQTILCIDFVQRFFLKHGILKHLNIFLIVSGSCALCGYDIWRIYGDLSELDCMSHILYNESQSIMTGGESKKIETIWAQSFWYVPSQKPKMQQKSKWQMLLKVAETQREFSVFILFQNQSFTIGVFKVLSCSHTAAINIWNLLVMMDVWPHTCSKVSATHHELC